MSAFLTPLRMEYIPPWEFLHETWNDNNGTPRWQLTEALSYHSDLLKRDILVPIGFRNDGPSVPTLPLIYARYGCRYMRPAVVHDYLCYEGYVARHRCDMVFLEAMRVENETEIEAMHNAGIDDDDILERKASLEGLALEMFAAVVAYSSTGLWKIDTTPIG